MNLSFEVHRYSGNDPEFIPMRHAWVHVKVRPLDWPQIWKNEVKDQIQKNQVAALARCDPMHPRDMAELCLEMAKSHPEGVAVLLWNQSVFEQAVVLVRDAEKNNTPQDDMLALVHAILNAGHRVEGKDFGWPAVVCELVKERQKISLDYWNEKERKFKNCQPRGELNTGFSKGFPFFSKSKKKCSDNLMVALEKGGKPLQRHHLAQAVQVRPKDFLKEISAKDVSRLDLEKLERDSAKTWQHRGEYLVQCSTIHFGRLLAHLSCTVPRGKSQSFGMRFGVARDMGDVHEMRVFLEKPPGDSPMMKVSLYDPEATGDMAHLRTLPEELWSVGFYSFARRLKLADEVRIVNLMLDNQDLARALTGRAIPQTFDWQVESLLTGLAYGSKLSVQVAFVKLAKLRSPECIEYVNGRSKDLASALHVALAHNHGEAIGQLAELHTFGEFLQHKTVEEMVWAKDGNGVPGLFVAVHKKSVEALKSFGELLQSVAACLNEDVAKEVILARLTDVARDLATASQTDSDELASAYCGVLKVLRRRLDSLAIKDAVDRWKDMVSELDALQLKDRSRAVYAWCSVLATLVGGWGAIRDVVMQPDEKGVPWLFTALRCERENFSQSLCQLFRGRLSTHSHFLDPDIGEKGLQRAIERQDKTAVRTYLELLIAVQDGSLKFTQSRAESLLEAIRSTYETRFLGCCLIYTDEYKRLVKSDMDLHALFKQAERSLRP